MEIVRKETMHAGEDFCKEACRAAESEFGDVHHLIWILSFRLIYKKWCPAAKTVNKIDAAQAFRRGRHLTT